jgi:hypothetical protein
MIGRQRHSGQRWIGRVEVEVGGKDRHEACEVDVAHRAKCDARRAEHEVVERPPHCHDVSFAEGAMSVIQAPDCDGSS